MKKYLILLIALLFIAPPLVYCQSDLVEVMTPNAMIIFDTSSSMTSKADGSTASVSLVKVDKDGNVEPDGVGPWTSYKFEGGGNHPDSKLYQAKLALKKVITDLVNINLGFSTYAQFKNDARRGYYYRDRWNCTGGQTGQAPTCTSIKLYWRWNNYRHYYSSQSSLPLGSFTDVWGQPQTGMAVNSKLDEKNHTFRDNTVQPSGDTVPPTYKADLEYSIYSIGFNAEMNVYTYYYQSVSHDHYEEQNQSVNKNNAGCLADCSNCSNSDCTGLIDCSDSTKDFKNPWQAGGGWKTYYPAEPEYSPKWKCSNATFSCKKANPCTYGAKFQEWSWQASAGTSCLNTVAGAYNYPAQNPASGDSYTDWYYVDSCYDASGYTYPSNGTTNYPHAWSYFHTSLPNQGGIWPLSSQPSPFYPSGDASTPRNFNDNPGTLDNHYFFVNIPQVDDSTKGYPIKNSILGMLDLTPVQSSEPKVTGNWWTKLPIKPNSLTSNTSGSPVYQTPIADSLYMAKRYYDDYIKQDPPSQARCRGNYIIFLTDGLESCRFLDPGTNLKPDFDSGMNASKDLFNLGVNTFVIGFGKDAGANINALNNIARAGSNNVYDAFFTDTLAGLTSAIQSIFQIIGGSYARSSPVVASARNRIYRGYFNLPGYEGHLAAFDLNPDGTLITPEKWDAGSVMKSNGRGPVSTWVDGAVGKSKGDFKDVDLTDKKGKKLEAYLNPLGQDINNDGKVKKDDSQAIVGFTLDPNYDDGKNGAGFYKGVRSAKWLLGDIYHSTPLVVGAPNLNFPDIAAFSQKYSDFKNGFKSRETIIYVGANDGMLHAFSDKDGREKFGIVPNNLLGKLKELRTNSHQFHVDSSPRAYDVFMGGSWSTVLVSGERSGGNSYFALDVTDPTAGNYPGVLWDVTDPGMGDTWSRPEIGWVRIGGQEKFVAFVGGGYSTTDGVGNTFYVIDVADGTILRKFIVGAASNKIPAGATVFDSDMDGRVNGVYFGDFNGVLWKIKIDGEEDIDKWQLISLYTPGNNSPVFYPPAVTRSNQGKILVYYGQGNEVDIFKSDSNSFFEIWDNAGVGVKNWEESFELGEKMLAAPAMANNVVYFTSWKYTGDKTDCGAGKGRLWGLTTTGAAGLGDVGALVIDPLTGTDLGGKKKYFEITDYYASRGIPSAPVVTNGIIYLSSSIPANQIRMFRIPRWGGQMRLKKWREVF